MMFTKSVRSFGFLLINSAKAILPVILCSAALLLPDYQAYGAEPPDPNGNFKNPDAVQRVLSKKETVANAAWWGFSATDSTDALQSAINSGAKKVVVPYMGQEWLVRPIKLASDQEIVFEPGVVVMAKEGEFQGEKDCLFSAFRTSNTTLRGYGAALRMRKKDYQSSKYRKSEWRHVILLRGSTNVSILGLRLESSGGDGICIGEAKDGSHIPCKNVLIKDCICDDNHRQGISVGSVDTLRVENCVLSNTRGAPPGAGIDLEPDNYKNVLANVVVSNCLSENNAGSGFNVCINHLDSRSSRISMLFVDCYVRNCGGAGLRVLGQIPENRPEGLIEFKNCVSESQATSGVFARWKVDSAVKLRFTDCKWHSDIAKIDENPIRLTLKKTNAVSQTNGIEFVNCYVYDRKNRAFLKIYDTDGGEGGYNVKGDINVYNPYGARMDLGRTIKELPLKVKSFKARE
jgi:hypothetical protein